MTSCTFSFPSHEGVDLSVRLGGVPDAPKLLEILAELERVARERSARSVLIDESDLDFALLSPSDVQALVRAWRKCPTLGEAFIAVLAMKPLVYGMNRMAQAFSDRAPDHLAVFRTREAALAWLRSRASSESAAAGRNL